MRLMGRSAPHIALECALQCHPNMCLIGEEVAVQSLTPRDVALQIADIGTSFGCLDVNNSHITLLEAVARPSRTLC